MVEHLCLCQKYNCSIYINTNKLTKKLTNQPTNFLHKQTGPDLHTVL